MLFIIDKNHLSGRQSVHDRNILQVGIPAKDQLIDRSPQDHPAENVKGIAQP
jgi:hypothetical protein